MSGQPDDRGNVVLLPGVDPRVLGRGDSGVTSTLKHAIKSKYDDVIIIGIRNTKDGLPVQVLWHTSTEDMPTIAWAVNRLADAVNGAGHDEDDDMG